MPRQFHFQFGSCPSTVSIGEEVPRLIQELSRLLGYNLYRQALAVCDENTAAFARGIFCGPDNAPETVRLLTLAAGEENKCWAAVESIIRAAQEAGLGRDGLFIGIGGGVICDLTAFAASVYMRGAPLALIPTTLLCMADAALGGKTGFNTGGIKNLAGSFYPAQSIVIASEALGSLPQREWKSGMAELIKTAIIDKDPVFFNELMQLNPALPPEAPQQFLPFIEKALLLKGRIVKNDPEEKAEGGRATLNLGHSFGHALESALIPGTVTHGEAVAWGIARACELGLELGVTPGPRAAAIKQILTVWGFDTSLDLLKKTEAGKFSAALLLDKKKKAGRLRFVVPADTGVVMAEENETCMKYINMLIKESES